MYLYSGDMMLKRNEIRKAINGYNININIDSIIEYFYAPIGKEDVSLFIDMFQKLYHFFLESHFFDINKCIDKILLQATIEDDEKAILLNIKTYCSLLLNDNYSAIDAIFKFRTLNVIDHESIFLNFSYLMCIYYNYDLLDEIINERINFLSKINLKKLPEHLRAIYYLNMSLVYAKQGDADTYLKTIELAEALIEKLNLNDFKYSLELTKISAKMILYRSYARFIDFDETINRYKNLLDGYFDRTTISVDTIDAHMDIINNLIAHEHYSEATEIILKIYDLVRMLNSKRELLGALKIIYINTRDPKLELWMNRYNMVLEECNIREKRYFRFYAANAFSLFEKSSNYNRLLDDFKHDALTSAYSRAAFMDLDQNISSEGFMIYYDLNNFKLVNDIFGHKLGDRCLITFSDVLRQIFDNYGSTYRLGGDGFLTIIYGVNHTELEDLLGDLSKQIKNLFSIYEIPNLGFSAGISTFKKGITIEDALNQADEAMYHAKRVANRDYCFYEELNN